MPLPMSDHHHESRTRGCRLLRGDRLPDPDRDHGPGPDCGFSLGDPESGVRCCCAGYSPGLSHGPIRGLGNSAESAPASSPFPSSGARSLDGAGPSRSCSAGYPARGGGPVSSCPRGDQVVVSPTHFRTPGYRHNTPPRRQQLLRLRPLASKAHPSLPSLLFPDTSSWGSSLHPPSLVLVSFPPVVEVPSTLLSPNMAR